MRPVDKSDESDDREMMSLRAAARLAGTPRAYLDECVASGRLAVHFRHTSKGTKFRVTRAALEAAGILPRTDSDDPTGKALVQLLREQAERLAAVEEQRFQLAGQLGAALERNRMLEERMLQLAATSEAHSGVDASSSEPGPRHQAEQVSPEQPTAPKADSPSPATLRTAKRVIGAKPAPDGPSNRATTAFARLRGIVRRSGGQ